MGYGLRISKAGYDATNSDDRNLIFRDDANSPKIYINNHTDLSVSGTGSETFTLYTHSMGYTPTFLVYIEAPKDSDKMCAWTRRPDSGIGASSGWWDAYADSTTLKVDIQKTFTDAGTYHAHFIIFADPAKTTTATLTPSGTYGLKITKPTKSTTSTDLKDYTFHSEYPPLSIVKEVSISVTDNAEVSSAHGLGFRPAFSATAEYTDGGNFYQMPFYIYGTTTHEVYVDATNVYARVYSVATGTRDFKIKLFNVEI